MHTIAMCHVLLHIVALWMAVASGGQGGEHLVELRPPIPVRMGSMTVGRPIEITAFEGDALELPCKTTKEDVVAWYRGDETTPLWESEERFTAIKVLGVETLVVDPVSLNDTKLFYCRSSDAIIYYDITVQASVELPDDFDQMDLALQLHLSGLQTGDQLADVFGAFSDDEALNAAEGLGSPHNSALLMHPGYPQTSEPFDAVSLRGDRKALIDARNAVCAPELRTVELDVPHMTGVFVTPKCVRLHRCGGCCMGPLIECRASQTKNITLKLTGVSKKQLHGASDRNTLIRSRYVKSRAPGSGRRRRVPVRRSSVLVTALNHTACACQCRVQAHECGPLHSHDQCRCHCKNQASKKDCLAHSTSHRWDEDTCECRCLTEQRCSTSLFFDHRSCSCVSASELGALARVSTGGGSRRARLSSDLTSFGGVIFGL